MTTPTPGGHPAPRPPSHTERVTLVSVGEPQTTQTGRAFVACYFKRGVFGKPVRRSFWAAPDDDGTLVWERASPDELRAMVGHDLTGTVEVLPLDIEPKEITNLDTGEVTTIHSLSVVRLADETVDRCAGVYGVTPRQSRAEVLPLVPAGFHVVGGDGQG